jgi:hypothetical protein
MIDRRELPRTTPRGVFGALIRCECGHGIGAHTPSGCSVGVYATCGCRLADGEALARAIGRASTPAGERRYVPMPKLHPEVLGEKDVDDVAAFIESL